MAQFHHISLVQCVCCLLLLAGGCAGRELQQQDDSDTSNSGPNIIRSSAQSSMCLAQATSLDDEHAMPRASAVTLSTCVAGNLNQQWELTNSGKLRSVGSGRCLAFASLDDACLDLAPECAAWASRGECQANPDYMVGVGATGGQCRASCKVCLPNTCVDLVPECPAWALNGECQANPDYMLGSGTQAGRCRASCWPATCKPSASVSASCVDLAPECAAWAARGECQTNPNYMVGVGATGGHCRARCKVCKPTSIPLTLVDCNSASTYKWTWSFERYLRPASQPRLCLTPPSNYGDFAALSACPAPEARDVKLMWQLERVDSAFGADAKAG